MVFGLAPDSLYQSAPLVNTMPYGSDCGPLGERRRRFNTVEAEKQGLTKPVSWQDLTKPEYKGKIVMPNPASSAAFARCRSPRSGGLTPGARSDRHRDRGGALLKVQTLLLDCDGLDPDVGATADGFMEATDPDPAT